MSPQEESHRGIYSHRKKKVRCQPVVSARYHHSSCVVDNVMYVFGGCFSELTIYNDLWKFDLKSKIWTRIIATGALPLPRLCPSFTLYKMFDEESGSTRMCIVLFGGTLISRGSQNEVKLCDQVHRYDIEENRWTLLEVSSGFSLASCNHSAVIIGDQLIIHGGHRRVDSLAHSTIGVYAFHLKKHIWQLQTISKNSRFGSLPISFMASSLTFKRNSHAFELNNHSILFIMKNELNPMITVGMLTRKVCQVKNCELCEGSSKQSNESALDSEWDWSTVKVKQFIDCYEYSNLADMCRVGNMIAMLVVKRVKVNHQVHNTGQSVLPMALNRSGLPPFTIRDNSLPKKRTTREERFKRLEFYKQFENNVQELNVCVTNGRFRLNHLTMQLRLIDISRVLADKEVSYLRDLSRFVPSTAHRSTSPIALAHYTLVAGQDSIVLFGGHSIDPDESSDSRKTPSNRLYMLVAKPKAILT